MAGDRGDLTLVQQLPTQGLGTGGGLGSQGAVTLSGDGRHLFVVNAASHTVSTFALRRRGVELVSVVPSGGLMPTSVTEHHGLVYVLNAAGSGNVAGFRNDHGSLSPLGDGQRGLSANTGTAPGQVGFGGNGEWLVVTERATNRLSTWPVRRNGTLGALTVTPSAGITPFGFAFDGRDHLIVSEAFGGAPGGSAVSSYAFDERQPAQPVVLSASVATTQTAACWVAIGPDGKTAYVANAGHSSISTFLIARSGRIHLAQAAAGLNGINAGATDLVVSPNGRRLYALAPRAPQIVAYRTGRDGALERLGVGLGLPASSVGIAAD